MRTLFRQALCLITSVSLLFQGCASTAIIERKSERGKLISSKTVSKKSKPSSTYQIEVIAPTSVRVYEKLLDYTELNRKYEKIEKIVERRCSAGSFCDPKPGEIPELLFASFCTLGILPVMLILTCPTKDKNSCRSVSSSQVLSGELISDSEYIPNEASVRLVTSGSVKVSINGTNLQDIPIHSDGTAVLQQSNLFAYPKLAGIKGDLNVAYKYKDKEAKTTISKSEIKKILASRTPPNLKIKSGDISFGKGLKSGLLPGDSQGEVRITIVNADKEGTAWGVKLAVTGGRCADVSYEESIAVGNMKPGDEKSVSIPITAGLDASDCKLNLIVQAKEDYGQDSRKVTIPTIAVKPMDKPDITIPAITYAGTAQNGRSLELTATIRNSGIGEAKGVALSLSKLPEGIVPSWRNMNIGDMPPRSTQKIPLTLQIDKFYGKRTKSIDLALTVSDQRPIAKPFTKRFNMDFHYASPIIKIADIEYFDGNDPGGLSEGNSNGRMEQDERILARVRITNAGDITADHIQVAMTPDNPNLTISPSMPIIISSLRPNEIKTAEFKFRIPNSINQGLANFTVSISEKSFSTQLKEVSSRTIYETGAEEGRIRMSTAPVPVSRSARLSPSDSENIDEVPSAGYRLDDAYALVIGIGRYKTRGIKQLPYAKKDAQTIREYLANIGGIPRSNIHVLTDEDATLAGIKKEIGWLRKNAKERSKVFIYYSGHGVSDNNHLPYLLPYDGETPSIEDTGYGLSQLKSEVNKFKTKNILVALDACYTGEGRSETMEGKRGVAWADDDTTATEATIINSSKQKESSWDYDEKQHGLFTYYFLKGMRGAAPDINGDGYVDGQELYEYLKKEIPAVALKMRNVTQTPVMQGNGKGVIISKRIQ